MSVKTSMLQPRDVAIEPNILVAKNTIENTDEVIKKLPSSNVLSHCLALLIGKIHNTANKFLAPATVIGRDPENRVNFLIRKVAYEALTEEEFRKITSEKVKELKFTAQDLHPNGESVALILSDSELAEKLIEYRPSFKAEMLTNDEIENEIKNLSAEEKIVFDAFERGLYCILTANTKQENKAALKILELNTLAQKIFSIAGSEKTIKHFVESRLVRTSTLKIARATTPTLLENCPEIKQNCAKWTLPKILAVPSFVIE